MPQWRDFSGTVLLIPRGPGLRVGHVGQLRGLCLVWGRRRDTGFSRDVLFIRVWTFWSPCGRRDEVVGGSRRLLVISRTSSWVVPPPKVVFYKEAPGVKRSERLYCSSAERAVGTSQRRVVDRVRRRIRRDRLLWSLMGAWTSRSSRSTTLPQVGRIVGGSRKAPSVSTWP